MNKKLVLVISSNQLLKEIIHETQRDRVSSKILDCEPNLALSKIQNLKPDVILIDEMVDTAYLEKILAQVRKLERTRSIVINLQKNEIILIDSRRATIKRVTDLTEAIMTEYMQNTSVLSKNDILIDVETANNLANIYGFLATIFDTRPDSELVRRLKALGMSSFVGSDATYDVTEEIIEGLSQMSVFFKDTSNSPEEEVVQQLAIDWTRLFRGLSPDYGPPPPYEAVYIDDGRTHTEIMEALNHFYHDCGSIVEEDYTNRIDYLGLELAFLAFLSEREALHLQAGDIDQSNYYRDKARDFIDQHIGLWAEKFFASAVEYAKTDFFQGFLVFARGVIAQIVEQNQEMDTKEARIENAVSPQQ